MTDAPSPGGGDAFASSINSALVEIELELRFRDEGHRPRMLALGTGELRAIVAAAAREDALRAEVEGLRALWQQMVSERDQWADKADAAESLAAERAAEVGRLTSQDPSDAMVKAGVAFALGVTIGGDYRWPDYIRDLYQVMRGAASGGGDDA